jgi:hypothetical protein
MGLAPIMGLRGQPVWLAAGGLAGGAGQAFEGITAGSRADLNGEPPLFPSLVRPGSLEYAGLRGERVRSQFLSLRHKNDLSSPET